MLDLRSVAAVCAKRSYHSFVTGLLLMPVNNSSHITCTKVNSSADFPLDRAPRSSELRIAGQRYAERS